MEIFRKVVLVAFAMAATYAAIAGDVAWTVLFCTMVIVTTLDNPSR